jgi:two-component system LytT family sensor kinase
MIAPVAPAEQHMTVPIQRNRMVLLVFGVGIASGLHLGMLHLFLWRSWAAPVTFLAASTAYAAVCFALWRWVLPRLTQRSFVRQLTLEIAVCLAVFGSISIGSTVLIASWLGAPSLFGIPHGEAKVITITPEIRQQWVWIYAFLPVLPVVIMTLLSYHQVYRRMRALQSRAEQLRDLAATAQLAALRAQLNPHFLFNSLNSIAQLIHHDPDKAEACVERLAEILRYVLRRSEEDFVPLADELGMTRSYLEIEQARFEDRLHVESDVDADTLGRLVPNLILQPLVENAVKHGLATKMGPGTVRIEARVADGVLCLSVFDDGVGMNALALSRAFESGVGLRNLRERLHHLYGQAGEPNIESRPGMGTRVEIRLPLVLPEAA